MKKNINLDIKNFEWSEFDRIRLRDLADNIREELSLLKDYEEALRYEDDPRRRARYHREIEQLRTSAATYQQEYNELRVKISGTPPQQLQDIGTQLAEMDAKLDALLEGQTAIQDDLTLLAQNGVLAHFDASQQTLIATIVERLSQSQLALIQDVLNAVETDRLKEYELQETLEAVQQVIPAIRQSNVALSDPNLVSEVEHISEALEDPQLNWKSQLKLSVPIIPLILSYEGEMSLENRLNLEKVWDWLGAKLRGKR